MLTKQEAQEKHARIIKLTGQYINEVGPIALEMREREGWRALGFKNWTDYCHHVGGQVSAVNVMRLAQKAGIEQNVQASLPMRHALALARLPLPEAQREVFEKVKKDFPKPIERNYETYVDRWFREHDKPTDTSGKSEDGWTRSQVDADEDLSHALDRIEEVYGHADRKAIQNGTIGLTRKDIIALASFHESRMKAIHYLIMANHWDVARALRFVNSTPTSQTKLEEIHNHVLASPGFYYTWSINGIDYQAKACHALANKAKGQANGLS